MNASISRADVGAWVVMGNPARWRYFDRLADSGLAPGDVRENAWSVPPNYRVDLIRPGDLVVLWMVSFKESGIYELGVVTHEVPPEEGPIDPTYLNDPSDRSQYRFVDFKGLILPDHVPTAALKADPVLRSCEHFRAPQTSPSYLTVEETQALAGLVGATDLDSAGWRPALSGWEALM